MEKTFELEAESGRLPSFRIELRELLQGAQCDEKAIGEVVLAVQEALTNIVRHAYGGKTGKIEVTFRDRGDRIEIGLQDFGKKFDPLKFPEPELPPKKPGGLGIYLMKTLMDEVTYSPECKEGNLLQLVKYKKKEK